MAEYKPSAKTFETWDEEFTPSAQHFDQWDQEPVAQKPQENINEKLQAAHPIIYKLAEQLARHPKVASAVEGIGDSPVSEAALSMVPSFVNALGNVANLPEVFTGRKTVPKMQRAFPEPEDLRGRIGSGIGSLIGSGAAFSATPYSGTIPGALAAGFAEGEGGVIPRSMDALIGLLLPGLLHSVKLAKNVKRSRAAKKDISGLELEKAAAERGVFGAKESLADKLTKEVDPVKDKETGLKTALDEAAGTSESLSKQSVATHLKKAEKDITDKYSRLYEGFNTGEAGQSLVKEPLQIESLTKEYGLKPKDFSAESQNLIEKLVGKTKEQPEGRILSPTTGKPLSQANIALEQAETPKVADYINLWKQLRAEVAEYRHSGKRAETPESKRMFREKANQLEKLADDVHEKSMGSLTKEQQKEYAKIQQGYLNERVPFLEKPQLKQATDKFAEVPDDYYSKLNKSGINELLNTFKKEHPDLVQAITKHDLRNASKMSADKLKEMISGDFGNFMPEGLKKTLKDLHLNTSTRELLTKALGKVQASEIGRKVKASDIGDILKERPDLAKPFGDISKEQKRLREIKNALVDAGFKLKSAEKELQKYKKAGSVAKLAGAPVGAYAGVLKAKGAGAGDIEGDS